MIYPKTPFCPMNDENMNQNTNGNNGMGKNNMQRDRNTDEGMNRNGGANDSMRRNNDMNDNMRGSNGMNNDMRRNSGMDDSARSGSGTGGNTRTPGDGNMRSGNSDNGYMNGKNTENMSRQELMSEIQQLDFAATELTLFLDTHPNDEDALSMFVKVASALKSLKHDYATKYGPIYVTDSSDNAPFDWVAPANNWPWQI